VERLAGGGRLFHCRWCRLQFFDRRRLATDVNASSAPVVVVQEVEKTAGPAQ
jgi:hypothetical protein